MRRHRRAEPLPIESRRKRQRSDELVAKIRMGRTGERAELLGWMASPACSFTTGFTFDLSGGRATY